MSKFVVILFYMIVVPVSYAQQDTISSQLVIDKLQSGEEFSIIVDSKGYGYYSDSIIISRERRDNEYLLLFNGAKNVLSKSDINQIRDFENQIYGCCSHFGCSETSTYRVIYKNQSDTFEDDGCELNRISMLLSKLNIEYR